MHPANKTAELTGTVPPIRPHGYLPRKDRMNLVLAKRLVYQWLGRTIPGPVSISTADGFWWHVSLFDFAVITDASQAGIRIRRRDKQALKRLFKRGRKALRRLRKEAHTVQRNYRDAFPELISRQNWERLYGMG
jgi:galactofuranosylgalactofuranosylrhamnosyl-N-acetylglucosaminyl-diphospho-decaprenol beta-1,5/1,6-galactofuranosyltransferase